MTTLDHDPTKSAPKSAPGSAAGRMINLAFNETPFPPTAHVVDACADAARRSNAYPDPTCAELVAALARYYEVPAWDIAVGAGSVAIMDCILAALTTRGEAVVHARPSFEGYPLLASRHGLQSIGVPLVDGGHDLEAMAAAVTDSTRIVVICNPHSPTGTILPTRAIEQFIDKLPTNVHVLLDEAYHEFARDSAIADGVDLYRDRANVMVLRTFSKARGLAGLRVGYLIADKAIASAIRMVTLPFSVSRIAQAAAVASLRSDAELVADVATVRAERDRVRSALIERGWQVPPSQANFLWVPLGQYAVPFAEHCKQQGLLINVVRDEGVRVTIGQTEENDALIAAAGTVDIPPYRI